MNDDDDAERLLAAVRAVRRGTRAVGGGPLRQGLTGAQTELLRLLRREPGISVGEAARRLALAGNTVSTLVRQLVENGHVVREPDPDDARTARLRLTAATDDALREWRDRRHAAVAGALAAMDPALRAQVDGTVDLLEAVAAALEGDA
ncbi:MarR family winged helix-turn-helix transcriptional regulator [Tsukamurella spumae]|uniref:MarR family transcriptional regulator n=1 Tax=Tsukamurella spumae TaxID=44753 RepID=A0A846WVU8_9ACTN|nr:MarR family transcriptional regulator [Tsukamurella spumae]NKY17143.1 MarR family transcriptional regulator [Tsukamurella spumae]